MLKTPHTENTLLRQFDLDSDKSDQKVSFLPSSFQSPRKYAASSQEMEVIKYPYPPLTPLNHKNYPHAQIGKEAQEVALTYQWQPTVV